MRRTRLFLGLFLITLSFALGVTAFAEYDPNAILPRPVNPDSIVDRFPGYLIVNTDNLFLRSGDGPRYTPLAILDGGTYLIVRGINGRSGDRTWWYVEVGGMKGWVKDEFVILRGDLRGTPIAESDGTILSPALYIGVTAPIYDELTQYGEVICNVAGDHFYLVLAQNASDPTWYKIRATCDGRTREGWVYAIRGILRNSAGVHIPVETS